MHPAILPHDKIVTEPVVLLLRAFTAASSQGSQSSSGLSGGMAWAFQDPEHGSTTSKASGAPTTTFVNPEYQPLATNRSQVGCLRCVPDLRCVVCVVP